MKTILSALFLLSPAFAEAKHINVLRNFSLQPGQNGYFQAQVHFDEEKPGRVSALPVEKGCSLQIRSKGNFFFMGRYRESLNEEKEPGEELPLWWRQSTHWSNGMDIWVSCKSAGQVTDAYIARVMGGYARLEP